MIIEIKKLSDLKPATYNARESTAKQEKDLKAGLTKFGMVEPIVFNKRTGTVVGGHFRIRELKKLGYDEIECVIVDLSLEDEKELNIRLNANTGQWDWDVLANEWDSVQLGEWGLDVPSVEDFLGVEEQEIEFSEYLDEAHNYVVLLFDSDVDWLSAQTHFGISSVHSMRANGKPWSKGIGRVINGAEYLKKMTGI